MTLDEFVAALESLPAGQVSHVPYDIFGQLFPPGEPDDEARRKALQLAMAHGCFIENRPRSQELLFIKK